MGAFTRILKACCKISSVKALPRIVSSSSTFQLLLWTVALVCGLSFGGYQVVKLIIRYFYFPTSVGIVEVIQAPPFPDVTICHQDVEWTARKLETELGKELSRNNYRERVSDILIKLRDGTNDYKTADYLKDSFGAYLQNTQHLINSTEQLNFNLIFNCSIVHLEKNPNRLSCFGRNIDKTFLDPVFGWCLTLQDREASELDLLLYVDDPGQDFLKEFEPNQDTHLSRAGAQITIHPHDSYPDIKYYSYYILPGMEYNLDLSCKQLIFLSDPYGSCISPELAQETGKPSYAVHRHGYECYRMCSKDMILNSCGCLHVYYHHEDTNVTGCGQLEDDISLTTERIACAIDTMRKLRSHPENCYCTRPCQEFEYDFTTESMPWPHHTYHISFYEKYIKHSSFADKFKMYEKIVQLAKINESAALQELTQVDLIQRNFARVRVINHQWKYLRYEESALLSIESIIGSIGGLCNIWAGISFFTIIEVIELLHLWLAEKSLHRPQKKKKAGQGDVI